MNISTLTKDEMTSHLAEVIDSQDSKILALQQERRALWILLGIISIYNLLF